VIAVFPGVQSLDVTGPAEVFAAASQAVAGDTGYRITLASPGGEPVITSSGVQLVPHANLSKITSAIDTLLVAGGAGTRAAMHDQSLLRAVRRHAARARRVASVCTGAFILAEAGLLEGRRATTHWAAADALARRYPGIDVDPEPIYVCDGAMYTSAGVTAGIDLALALVEQDLGRDVALGVARQLVLFLRRPANQAQFSATLAAQVADRQALRDLQRWMVDHPAADLSVPALAERSSMSTRHFARCFRQETGMTPGHYVETLRLEAARRRLEESADSLEQVCAQCGFGAPETMRRVFLRRLAVAPSEYRRRFQAPLAVTGDSTPTLAVTGDSTPPLAVTA
jgi:transcriptional regulator GlxA family with amidase domain